MATYSRQHRNRRKALAAFVASGQAVCWRCQLPILPGTPWDLGHVGDLRDGATAPEHRKCNRGTAKTDRVTQQRRKATLAARAPWRFPRPPRDTSREW